MDRLVIMDIRPLLAGVLGVFALPVCLAEPATLNLYTFEAPPYQVAGIASGATGETVATVICAATRAGLSANVRIAPQNRAIHSLKRNLIDGYFAIDPFAELDAVAARSDPVALDKWYFFTLNPELNTQPPRIGVVDGSNEQSWLIANDHDVFLSVTSPGQLLALLKRGRIDTALMDQRMMNDLGSDDSRQAETLHTHFLRYAPLYLYLSDTFASRHPDFLPQFNRFLPECMEDSLALDDIEVGQVEQIAERLFRDLNATLNLQQALASGPHLKTFADVLTIDSKWQALAPKTAIPLAEQILDLPASKALHAWQASHQGLVTEVMLINDMGTLAAISQLTSDFWQGDEAKFQEVMHTAMPDSLPDRAFHLSSIRFDSSTARFQITVSFPLSSSSNERPNGVLSFGLDIEEALNGDRPH